MERRADVVADRRRRASRRARTSAALLLGLVLLAGLGRAAPAHADSATISILTTTGASDPVAGVPRIFAISGVATVPKRLYVKYRAPGGAACAPTASSDSGRYVSFIGNSVNGAFRLQDVVEWSEPGEVVFCIWLSTGDSTTIATPITQTIAFRGPSGTISAGVSPVTPRPRERTTITVSGATETPARVYAKLRRAGGAACAPTASSDSGAGLLFGNEVNGAFSLAAETRQPAGTYMVCLWLADADDDPTPVAGPQSTTFTVAAPPAPPPPPCRVPALGRVRDATTVKSRIRAANCRVGRTIRVYSRKPSGRVLRLVPRPGRQLANRARVDLIVSRGRRSHRR